jgi:hypothetical protein
MKQHQFLIEFLKNLEAHLPPPTGAHHAIMFLKKDTHPDCDTDKLTLQVNRSGFFVMVYLDDSDFEKDPQQLCKDVVNSIVNEKPVAVVNLPPLDKAV